MSKPPVTSIATVANNKPLKIHLERFIQRSKKPGIHNRISQKQKMYGKFMDTDTFGDDDLIFTVDRAIMSCELWWVQHQMTKNFEEQQMFKALSSLFKLVNYNQTNPDGKNPLISDDYLQTFLDHPTTGKIQEKETFKRKYCKIFRKAITTQYCWIFDLFLHSSTPFVNHALHNFVFDEYNRRYCPFKTCLYCEILNNRDAIFGFRGVRYEANHDAFISYLFMNPLLNLLRTEYDITPESVSESGEGPFASSVKLAIDAFDVISSTLRAAVVVNYMWNTPLALIKGDGSLESEVNKDNIFELLETVEKSVKDTTTDIKNDINRSDLLDAVRARRTTETEEVQESILGLIDKFRVRILAHPINIILGSFLMDSGNQQTISKISIFDFEFLPSTGPNKAPEYRSPKSFLNSFPYDYLAAVYKIAFDIVVRMKQVWPSVASFEEELSVLPIYRRRAEKDIKEVGDILIARALSHLYIVLLRCR